MLADASVTLRGLLGDLALARPDGLPELIIDDPQLRNLGDDPCRLGIEPRDALAGRRDP